MIPKEFHHRGHRGRGIISFLSALLPLLLLLLLTPVTLTAQSPELVQAKAQVKALKVEMEKLDDVIEQELEAALARQTDTRPKGEFETTTEYQARLAAAKEARQSLEPEYERKKADRRRVIRDEIETLTSVPYPAPVRIRLGTYDADSQTFPFFVRATGDSGTIDIPREVAPDLRTNLPTLKQTGWWRVMDDGTAKLAAVLVNNKSNSHIGIINSLDIYHLHTLTGHTNAVLSVAFSPDGKTLISRSAGDVYKEWRIQDGTFIRTTTQISSLIKKANQLNSPDGKIFATTRGNTIELRNTITNTLLRTLIGHKGFVLSVAFSPDSEFLASCSKDSSIKVWRVQNGQLLKSLTGHSSWIYSIAFSPDGRTLASGSRDLTIKLWGVGSIVDDQFLAAIRSGAGGVVAAKGPNMPPALSAQVTFSEPSGDNILDAYEEGTLEITLTNAGHGAAYGVEVALTLRQSFGSAQDKAQGDVSGQAPALSFPARRYVGEIQSGKSQKASIPIKAGVDVADGKATLTCSFTEANGFEPDPVEITFDTRAYQPPALALADVGVDEPSGNGMIEPGEVVTIMVRVQNQGQGAAEDTRAKVNIGKNVYIAEGSETEFDLGILKPGAAADLEFKIYTNRRAREIPVSVTLTERHGRYGLVDAPLELPFNQPVRSIQQVVVEGKEGEVAMAVAVAGGLSIDIEQDIPAGRDRRKDAVALVIANRRYLDPDVPDVDFAHRDGEFVRQYLVRTLGYREGNILLYRDATLSNFRTALRKLGNAARKGSEVFVYYTGHGAPDPDEKAGYFVPVDCDPNYVKIGGVALEEFYRELGEIRAGNVTVVIDACFSGASEAGMLIQEASPVFISVEDPSAGLKEGVVLTSSSGDQISSWHPEQQHSLYTYYFLKGLQGAADTNDDRSLTVGELQAYLEEQVPYMARRLHNRTQTPMVTPGSEQRVLVRYK